MSELFSLNFRWYQIRLVLAITLAAIALSVIATHRVAAQSFGTVTIGQALDVTTLNPTQNTVKYMRRVFRHIFDPLLSIDADSVAHPVLCKRWKRLDDVTWRFYLRKGIKFHNGEPFTAEAVQLALKEFQTKPSRGAALFSGIFKEAKIIDGHTVDLITNYPYAFVVPFLADNLYPVPPKYYQKVGRDKFGSNPIGTGPYKFESWRKGDRVVLTANANHWKGKPKADKVIFWAMPEASTRVAALSNNEADVIANVLPAHAARLEKLDNVHLVVAPASAQPIWGGMVVSRPHLKDVRVRKAVNYAVNKQALVDKLLHGYGKVMNQGCAAGSVCWNPDLEPYSYNREKARQLLAEAGAKGMKLSIHFSGIVSQSSELAQAIAGYLRAVGIEPQLIQEEWAVMAKKVFDFKNKQKDLGDIFLIYYAAGPDVERLQFELFGEGGSYNWNHYANPKLTEIYKKAKNTFDETKRKQLFKEANRIVNEEVPWLFLYEPLTLWGVSNRFKWKAGANDMFFTEDMQLR
jgi:peptide/nickel transport system substrate-binding protein